MEPDIDEYHGNGIIVKNRQMTYVARLVDTEKPETRKFIFEGETMPSEKVFKKISLGLKDITYSGHPTFRVCEPLYEERGFLLTIKASSDWVRVCFSLIHYFAKQFPGAKVLNS